MKSLWITSIALCISYSASAQFVEPQIIDEDVFGISKIITADLNNNGFADIITSQKFFPHHKVSYFLNTGQESFEPQVDLTTDVFFPEGVAAGDLTGNGWADIAGISLTGNTVYWFANDCGSFSAEIPLDTTLVMPEDVEIVDIDNDGDPDIVVLDHVNIVVYYNDDSGNFTKVTVPNIEFEYYAFSIADLDGDGFQDIIIGGGIVLVFMNDNAQFTTHDIERSASIVNPGFAFTVHTADLNGDGTEDLIIDGNSNSEIRWYANDGSGFFTLMQTIETTHHCKSVSTADFDNDGDLDVFAALFQKGEVAWYQNDGQGTFGSPQSVSLGTPPNTTATAAADLNNDGAVDVIWAHPFSFQLNTVALLVNDRNPPPAVTVYPNPVRDRLTIKSDFPAALTVVDVLGKTLIDNHPINQGVNTLHLPFGPQVYLLKFADAGGVTVARVVKE